MNEDITLIELILELQPFSDELVHWCKKNPEFLAALKNIYPKKFISPAMVINSYPSTGDEIIGVYTYHHVMKIPTFKQDFIVNIQRLNEEFILYTRNPSGSSKYVKDISDFFIKYGMHGYKRADHHLSIEELPAQLRERAQEAIDISKKVDPKLLDEIPQEHIDRIYKEVMLIKRKDRVIIEKLKQ